MVVLGAAGVVAADGDLGEEGEEEEDVLRLGDVHRIGGFTVWGGVCTKYKVPGTEQKPKLRDDEKLFELDGACEAEKMAR